MAAEAALVRPARSVRVTLMVLFEGFGNETFKVTPPSLACPFTCQTRETMSPAPLGSELPALVHATSRGAEPELGVQLRTATGRNVGVQWTSWLKVLELLELSCAMTEK